MGVGGHRGHTGWSGELWSRGSPPELDPQPLRGPFGTSGDPRGRPQGAVSQGEGSQAKASPLGPALAPG